MKAKGLILLAAGLGTVAIFGYWLTGWRLPPSGLNAYFDQVIEQADVSDRFDFDGGGWDREDVTGIICNRVDVSVLRGLGMSDKPVWPIPFDDEPSRPTYVWKQNQHKGLIAACQSHSLRYLEIEIDAETFACSAHVSVFPSCDL